MAHSNHLIHETSPYLLQHAHNPVNWYPWGDEALQLAVKEDKPILVSIGYSACHWCHVMERESFEDEDTAAIMNEHFINIKIDREERPDLDHIYMDAVQAISGSGGWPLNVFLTPGCKPFYGGTYFPPVKAFNRSSWKEVLFSISKLFNERRNEVEEKAEELIQHIGKASILNKQVAPILNPAEEMFTKQDVESIYQNIMKQADTIWGGFGNAPKFPQTFTINYLLRYYYYFREEAALKQACLSLDKMIDGGIYDHAGGGFARYSTDREWLAPHFEKMLYDNALIISSLSQAYKLTKNVRYKTVVENTIAFLQRELMHPSGGFYAALDADSEGVEGKFYVWDYEEIREILGKDASIFCEYYDVSPNGNWEHKNILRILKPVDQFAQEQNVASSDLEVLLNNSLHKLLQYRSSRVRPATDDKIILGWNAMMVTALCHASAAFRIDAYKQLAINTYSFLLEAFTNGSKWPELYHTYKNRLAKYPAFLDDYAFLIEAALQLQEITSDVKYLEDARQLSDYVIAHFSDEENQMFYYTSNFQKDIVVRKKEIYDGALPSGNSTMAHNLQYLGIVYDIPEWKERVLSLTSMLKELTVKYPTSFGNWAALVIDQSIGINEIAVVGSNYLILRDSLLEQFIPGTSVLQSSSFSEHSDFPLLKNKTPPPDSTFIYLCRNYTCKVPAMTIKDFIKQIGYLT